MRCCARCCASARRLLARFGSCVAAQRLVPIVIKVVPKLIGGRCTVVWWLLVVILVVVVLILVALAGVIVRSTGRRRLMVLVRGVI